MCGIIGIVGQASKDAKHIEESAASLSKRGPDDRGIARFSGAVLAHTRLAIIDLSDAGHQPMKDAAASNTIVFNGEIYNHKEVRTEMHMSCGKCDPAKMAMMTKAECEKMCDSLGCTADEKAMCLSNYDADGKYTGTGKMSCCAMPKAGEAVKEIRIETTNTDGKVKSVVTTKTDGKTDTQVFEGTQAEVNAKLDALNK